MASLEARKANRPVAAKFRDLAEVGVPGFFFALLSQRFTGRVLVGEPSSAIELVFKGGLPVAAHARLDDGHRLGRILVDQKSITQVALDGVLTQAHTSERLLGQCLREAGLVDAISLERALKTQCSRRLVDLFARREAPVDVIASRPEASPVVVDPLYVIAEGVRVHFDTHRLAEELGAQAAEGRWKLDPQSVRDRVRFSFTGEESAVFDAMVEATSGFSRERLMSPHSGLQADAVARVYFVVHACGLLSRVSPKVAVVERNDSLEALLTPTEDALADGLPSHEVLGVAESASVAQLDAAYERLCASLQAVGGDAGVSGADKQRARDLLDALEETHRAARNRRTAVAERRALELERGAQYAGALEMLQEVLDGGVKSTKIRSLEAWCRFKASDDPRAAARSTLDVLRAIQAEGETARGQYYLGQVSLDAGDRVGALSAFEAALALDPEFTEAAEQRDVLRGEAHSGVVAVSPELRKRKAERTPQSETNRVGARPRSGFWSGPWPAIWVFSGALLVVLVAAQVVLRLDF